MFAIVSQLEKKGYKDECEYVTEKAKEKRGQKG